MTVGFTAHLSSASSGITALTPGIDPKTHGSRGLLFIVHSDSQI